MIDRTLYTTQELCVLDAYGSRCVIHPWAWADTLHHEPPRSLNPDYENQPWTWFPLCVQCHEIVQDMSRSQAEEYLTVHQRAFHPGAEGKSRTCNQIIT